MMKKVIISILCAISTFAFAEEAAAPPAEAAPKPDAAQQVVEASEAFGKLTALHLKSMESIGIKFNADVAIQAFKDGLKGTTELKPEMEYFQVLAGIREVGLKETAAFNLKEAEEFLAKNKNEPGVKELETDKLQYRVEKEGTGPAVEANSTPLVRYTGKFLGETADESSAEENRIDLSEEEAALFPGFKQALIGMKEGEKGIVFIHPGLAFPDQKLHIHANKLITFELEVLKANMPPEQPLDSLSTTPHTKGNPEIAEPFQEHKDIR
jgi:FKBP-type peptidyl-prolyl cis-trans isomerase